MRQLPRICDGFTRFKNIIIFGASTLGAVANTAIKENKNILAFSDNDQKKHGADFCGIKVIPPTEIPVLIKSNECAVLIASMYYGAISFQLSEMGICDFFVFSSMSGGVLKAANDYTIREPLNVSAYRRFLNGEARAEAAPPFLPAISSSQINYDKDKSKNILFAAYVFPPMGGSGVQRSSKFVKYLKRQGYNPIVIAAGKSNFLNTTEPDETLTADIPKETTIIRIDDPYYWDDNLTEAGIKAALNVLSEILNNPSEINGFLEDMSRYNVKNHRTGLFFTPWAANAISAVESVIDFDKIGAVYTSSAPYFDHFIGFHVKKRHKIPWIADFRDEWTNNPVQKLSDVTFIEKSLERCIAHETDALIATTEKAALNFSEICQIPKQKTHCITNGYDEDDFTMAEAEKPARAGDKLTIKYSGVFYTDNDPFGELITAINELIESGEAEAARLDIQFNGIDGVRKEELLRSCDRLGIIKMLPYREHIENIKSMQCADIILLFGHGEAVLPGKTFEYIRMGVPIFAIDYENGSIGGVIAKTRTGVCVDKHDAKGIKYAFKKMYDDYFAGTLSISPDKDEIKKYSRETLTKKLIGIIKKIGSGQ